MTPTRRTTSSWTIALTLLALTVAPGCKKKVPPPPVPDPVPVQTVESKLQVTTVSPGSIDADTAATAKVYGSAFAPGATVKVGNTQLSTVTVVDPNTLDVSIPPMPAGSYDVIVANRDGTNATLRKGLTVRGAAVASNCTAMKIYFGFDSAGLSGDAKRVLTDKMSCYQQSSGQVRIAGHADERGTTDYNLALGQRRATAVKTHLTSSGVAGSKVKTVSYGEERPDVRGANESAWAKNRRAEVAAD